MGKEKALRLWLEDKAKKKKEVKLPQTKIDEPKHWWDHSKVGRQGDIDQKTGRPWWEKKEKEKKRESKEKGKPKYERPCPTCGQHIGSANLVRMLKPHDEKEYQSRTNYEKIHGRSMAESRREGEKRLRERKLREPRENEDEKMEAKHSDANKTDYFVEEIRSNIIYHDKIAPLIGMIAGQAAQGLSEQGKKQGKQALDAVEEMSEEEQ
jgi:hypothetical protein